MNNFITYTNFFYLLLLKKNPSEFLLEQRVKVIVCERLFLYLTKFSEQLVFRALFQNSLSNIFASNVSFTFVSLNTFI